MMLAARFFLGKNKVLAIALGRTAEEEYKDNLHLVAKQLVGDIGMLVTSEPRDVVEE